MTFDPNDPTKRKPEYAYRRAQTELPGIESSPFKPNMTEAMWRALALFFDRGGAIPVRTRLEPLAVRADVLARLQQAGLIEPAYIGDRPSSWGITEAGRKLLASRGYKANG